MQQRNSRGGGGLGGIGRQRSNYGVNNIIYILYIICHVPAVLIIYSRLFGFFIQTI